MKPVDAIIETLVKQGFSQSVKDYKEKLSMLVPRLDIFISLVSWRDKSIKVGMVGRCV